MINADKNKKINADKISENHSILLYADLTYQVRGAIFNVFNELGYGHKEQVYQKALSSEFESQNIPFKREVPLSVLYKGIIVGNYRPDFVIDNKIIIELKAVDFVSKSFETQLLNYLKSTGYKLGLLINFGSSKLFIKRFINTYPRKSLIISENLDLPLADERR